ncbi:MAG: hypothetical protein JOZ96_00455 [Acidobacteria bacterium]|nr:hypothetical protein [Acidobacteriota bacterium]
MKRNLDLLTSPGFVAGLLLLLANDFLLKPAFHDALTGKLSDFAGLFVFPLFWAALTPRWRRAAYALTALGFVFWKSSYAQPLIDAWNSLGLLRVARVVDPTDLWALVALPASFEYLRRRGAADSGPSPFAPRRAAALAVLLLSVFAFAATQSAGDHMISEDREYKFDMSKEELTERLKRDAEVAYVSARDDPDDFSLSTRTKVCGEGVFASFKVERRGLGSLLKVSYLIYNCEQGPRGQEAALEAEAVHAFEHDVVEKLRAPAGP